MTATRPQLMNTLLEGMLFLESLLVTLLVAVTRSASGQYRWIGGPATRGAAGTAASPSFHPSNWPGSREPGAYAVYDTEIYVFGGVGVAASGATGTLSDFWIYRHTLGQWAFASYSTGSTWHPNGLGALRHAALAITNPTSLAVRFGGVGPADGSEGLVCSAYTPMLCPSLWNAWHYWTSPTWTLLNGSAAPNPNYDPVYPVARLGATLTAGASGDVVHLFGGYGPVSWDPPAALDDAWTFDPATSQLDNIGPTTDHTPGHYNTSGVYGLANWPGPRFMHAAWHYAANDTLIIYGGEDDATAGDMYHDVWEYSPALREWRHLAGATIPAICCTYSNPAPPLSTPRGVYLDTGLEPVARSGAGAAAGFGDTVYIFGGSASGLTLTRHCNDLWEFSLAFRQWRWLEGYCTVYDPWTMTEPIEPVRGGIGAYDPGNHPGSRWPAAAAIVPPASLLVFLGTEYDAAPATYGDLWEYAIAPFFCYGEPAGATACNGTGLCVAQDVCNCPNGTVGGDCSAWDCFGSDCSGHGACVAHNDCVCAEGYGDADCNNYTCSGVHRSHETVCSAHGVCAGADNCSCDPGYIGAACADAVCHGYTNCGGHGICAAPDSCACDPGYHGDVCHIWLCYHVPEYETATVCSGNGLCIEPDVCNCAGGWAGDLCHHPSEDLVHVAVCGGLPATAYPAVCSGHGWCVATDDCMCHSGYEGADCSTLPICSPVCGVHGECLELANETLACVCDVGWEGDACDVNATGRAALLGLKDALIAELVRVPIWDWDILYEVQGRSCWYALKSLLWNYLTISGPLGIRECTRLWAGIPLGRIWHECTWTSGDVEWCIGRQNPNCTAIAPPIL